MSLQAILKKEKYVKITKVAAVLLTILTATLLLSATYTNSTPTTEPVISTFSSPTYTLTFQGYDDDNADEVTVLVNGQTVASLPTGESQSNNNVWKNFALDISSYMVSGSNSLTFNQNLYSSGVRTVSITASGTVIFSDATTYSLRDGGSRPSVTYSFNTDTTTTTTTTTITSTTTTTTSETTLSVTPTSLGTHDVPEGSGIVASRTYPGIYWMMSDSGNPAYLYAIDWAGDTKHVFEVSGADNRDWEDIAIDESGHIWIGDTGDNGEDYSSYVLYKVDEPNPYGNETNTSVAIAYQFVYPNGARDAEALFIWQGTPYIVQKRSDTEVYAFPTLDASQVVTLNYVGKFTGGVYVTGADISADGRRLALISDGDNYHWIIERNASSTSIADFFTSPTKQWRISFSNQQGEAICFYEGYSFVVASEEGDFWEIKQNQYDNDPDG